MDYFTLIPPLIALAVAVWTRNVFWALGLAILASETLQTAWNPFYGALQSLERGVDVFSNAGNTRIILFCLLVGALIAYMRASGGIAAMVAFLQRRSFASTPRRAGLTTAGAGIVIFLETNISLLSTGLIGRFLFDRLNLSRERLAYIIDSTCAPVCILVLLNGWGFFIMGLMGNNGIAAPVSVLVWTVPLNFYPLLTLLVVFLTLISNRTFGPLETADSRALAQPEGGQNGSGESASEASQPTVEASADEPTRLIYMAAPMLTLIGGTLAFMVWTGGGNILNGSGSQSILWSVTLATLLALAGLVMSGRARGRLLATGFDGVKALIPAVTVIFLAFLLGNSLSALGTGAYIASLAQGIALAWLVPAVMFLVAAVTSFTTGTSWGTYAILVPIAIPLSIGAGVPVPLVIAAVMGGGVFGDHCSPISDTTIIASLAAGCDHFDHVRTQLPYAVGVGLLSTIAYLVAGILMVP